MATKENSRNTVADELAEEARYRQAQYEGLKAERDYLLELLQEAYGPTEYGNATIH